MSFQSLPIEVQVVAANVLAAMLTNPEQAGKEPAELAQKVVSAFEVLSGSRIESLITFQTVRIDNLLSVMEYHFSKLSDGNGGESTVV